MSPTGLPQPSTPNSHSGLCRRLPWSCGHVAHAGCHLSHGPVILRAQPRHGASCLLLPRSALSLHPNPPGLSFPFVYSPAASCYRAMHQTVSMTWNTLLTRLAMRPQLKYHCLRKSSLTHPMRSGLPPTHTTTVLRSHHVFVIYSHLSGFLTPVRLPHSGGHGPCLFLLTFVCLASRRAFGT